MERLSSSQRLHNSNYCYGKGWVFYWEVVPSSEGPLSEVKFHKPTVASDSSVFVVPAVVLSPWRRQALAQGRLATEAGDVVQIDGSGPCPKVRVGEGFGGTVVAELLTDHVGVLQRPWIVADRPPRPVTRHLHAALGGVGPAHQPDLDGLGRYIHVCKVNKNKVISGNSLSNLFGEQSVI